jgi:toxin FitB
VTFAETRFGIELVINTARRAELNDWLARGVRPMFEQRVLAITEDIMFKWRLLVEDGRKARLTPLTARSPHRSETLRPAGSMVRPQL